MSYREIYIMNIHVDMRDQSSGSHVEPRSHMHSSVLTQHLGFITGF